MSDFTVGSVQHPYVWRYDTVPRGVDRIIVYHSDQGVCIADRVFSATADCNVWRVLNKHSVTSMTYMTEVFPWLLLPQKPTGTCGNKNT